ncbi:hypothetical protein [Nitrospina watsonii]|uniref:DUF1778 domain-containing protein n=1 Tax=Nitrospina watsonii TaxID=1323948 RepID=A0ABM9HGJ4_9BACT|nr:hypothetical protein [Nitrospina watsonii]CAI2719366.1 conserved protein of unknown function [Nitrospina watsonii]
MAKAKKQSSKKKTSRTETIGFRLDPKLRFAAELAARKQRRSLSSFIEWAVEEATKKVVLEYRESSNLDEPPRAETAFDTIKTVWDVDEADRFAKLAMTYPELLTHDEEVLWKLICQNGFLWKGKYVENSARGVREWTWNVLPTSLIYVRLRDNWEVFKQVASGEKSEDCLPRWQEEMESVRDDIPF